MKKVSIVTLGCAKNTADIDTLSRVLKSDGHQLEENAEKADAIVVHTCSFIEAAKKESINTILQAGQLKRKDQQLIVTGCLVQQHGDEVFQELPEVDAFLGTGQLGQLTGLLEKPRARCIDRANPGGFMDPDLGHERKDKGLVGTSAYLRLSEGCSHPCSFCVIPRLRGPVQSRTEDAILAEARELASYGTEEFSLIAQDTGDWRRDQRAVRRPTSDVGRRTSDDLPILLRKLAQITGVRWIRLMYMHPASFTPELLSVFAENPDKFPYLDMPLQHIDSEMLTQMRRMTDEKSLRALLERIRTRVPELTLRTTFIVGAPGETEKQFERLLSFVKEGHFDYLGAFAYSKEEGTHAAERSDQIPENVKMERLQALTDAYYDVAHAKAQKRLGTKETVLLEETEGETVLGRTRREAPEIDAVVRLPARAARAGRFVTASLTGYDAHEYTATV